MEGEKSYKYQKIEIAIKVVLSIILSCLYLWYALESQNQTKRKIVESLDKIVKYEEAGYDATKFKQQLQEKNKEINSPLYLVCFWRFNAQNQEVDNILNLLRQDYTKSLANRRLALRKKLKDIETLLSLNTNSNLASYDLALSTWEQGKSRVNAQDLSVEEVVKLNRNVDMRIEQLNKEIEALQKQELFGEIAGYNTEADQIIAFFAKRGGYETEIEMIKKYKQNADMLFSDKYKDMPANKLKQIAHTQVIPILEKPKKTKAIVEEQERIIRIAKQKEIFEKYGVPPPPIEVHKLIVIDIAYQRLYAYEDGLSIFNYPVPVTTGKNGYSTVYGQFAIYSKASPFRMRSPFPNEHYDLNVNFWMPFYGSYGIHDAPWRSYFGESNYMWNGSHGCVNAPYNEIRQLYHWADVGTTVIVR